MGGQGVSESESARTRPTDPADDAAAIGAALLLVDLHEAVAEAAAQLAALAAAAAPMAPPPMPPAAEATAAGRPAGDPWPAAEAAPATPSARGAPVGSPSVPGPAAPGSTAAPVVSSPRPAPILVRAPPAAVVASPAASAEFGTHGGRRLLGRDAGGPLAVRHAGARGRRPRDRRHWFRPAPRPDLARRLAGQRRMSGLTLGPVVFEAFEVPGRIAFGGRQRLAVHALPGGARIVDAMGRDDAPVAWAGVFTGSTAGERVRLLDLLRVQGQPLSLVWDEFVYDVVIASLDARFERSNWIPYRISCVVLSDLAVPDQLVLSLTADLLADLASAALYPGVDLSAASAAVTVAGATTLGTQAHGQSQVALAAAAAQASSLRDAAGVALGTARTVAQAAAAAGQMARAAASVGYLRRAAGNLARAGT
jgi:hypothetical protein